MSLKKSPNTPRRKGKDIMVPLARIIEDLCVLKDKLEKISMNKY